MKALEHRFGYGLTIFIMAVCSAGAIGSLQFKSVSQWFPLFAGVAGASIALLVLVIDVAHDVRARRAGTTQPSAPPARDERTVSDSGEDPHHVDDEPAAAVLLGFIRNIAWLAALMTAFVLFSMPIAVFVWILFFIRFAADESWLRAVISGAAMTTLLIVFCAFLDLSMPEGLVLDSSLIIPTWRL
jgi:hypothetical protein